MKSTFLILSFLLLINTSFAQGGDKTIKNDPASKAQMRADHLKVKLNLSEEQRDKIYQIALEEAKASEAEWKTRQARRQKNDASIKSILSEEQSRKFEELRSTRREHRNKQRVNNGVSRPQSPANPVEEMKK